MSGPTKASDNPYEVSLKNGDKYAWCACGESKNQPFCDGAHNKLAIFKPVVFQAENDETVFLCGCKQTNNGPYCDGTHNKL